MTKLVLTLLASSMIAAPALADSRIDFRKDGIVYTGTVVDDHGVRHIVGQCDDGKRFNLNVVGRHVSGTFNGIPVSYSIPEGASTVTASR